MNRYLLVVAAALALLAPVPLRADPVAPSSDPTLRLALALEAESDFPAAAIEYRRLAESADSLSDAASWLWLAARAYSLSPDARVRARAWPLLDRAEDADPDRLPALAAALRGSLSLRDRDYPAAAFHFTSALPSPFSPTSPVPKEPVQRARAASLLLQNRPDEAAQAAAPYPDALAAVQAHSAARRKSPTLGGILGLVPGFGYAYSGEWANAVRSILLNSLFIWAMRETAADDEWALFSVSTFFEFIWYSGSVYGGIDSAHRHNRQIDQTALDAILAPNTPSSPLPAPDPVRLPLLSFPI